MIYVQVMVKTLVPVRSPRLRNILMGDHLSKNRHFKNLRCVFKQSIVNINTNLYFVVLYYYTGLSHTKDSKNGA